MRVIWRQLLVHPAQIEQTVDLPHQMIGWDHLVEIKRIEKLSLSIFPPPHHAPLPLMPSLHQRNHGSRVVSTGVLQHNRGQSGSHMLAVSFSGYDPFRKSALARIQPAVL